MPYLKMYIGRVFFDKARLERIYSMTSMEIDDYYATVALQMHRKNIREIKRSGIKPKFFIDNVPSLINDMDISDKEMQEFENLIVKKMKEHANKF